MKQNKKIKIYAIISTLIVMGLLSIGIFSWINDIQENIDAAYLHCESIGYEDFHITRDTSEFKCVNYIVDPITKENSLNITNIIKYKDVRTKE